MIRRLKFRSIVFPILFFAWYFLSPGSYTIPQVVIYSLSLSVGSILFTIIIDYKTNSDTAEKLHVPVEKVYQARYEIGWGTDKILALGTNFEIALDAEIHNRAVARLKEERRSCNLKT